MRKKQIMRWRNKAKRKSLIDRYLIPGKIITIFDTETTGLKDDSKIIQFSAIKYLISEDYTLSRIKDMDIYINPEEKLKDKITEITGITDEMLATSGNEEYWGPSIITFIENSDVIAGYNIPFDMRMVNNMSSRLNLDNYEINCIPEVDVMEMARDWVAKKDNGSHKLSEITAYLLPDMAFRFHSSMDDVKATAELLELFIRMYRDVDDDMVNREQIHLEYGKIIVNPRKQSEQRIKLALSQGEFGDVFWDIKDQEWGCCTNTRAKQLFNRIDLENLEDQFLQKYGYKFGNDTPKAVADQWTKFRNEKKKERKQSL